MKKNEPNKSSENETPKKEYYFGKVEVIPFEELNLPQFELSVFASADLNGGYCDGGGGDFRTCPAT